MFTTASGTATNLASSGFTKTQKDADMRVPGRITSNTAKAMKPGRMEPATRVSTPEVRKKVVASTLGLMGQYMMASGRTIGLMASVSTSGLTVTSTSVSGEMTKCTVTEFICTQMALDSRASSTTTRKMDTVCTLNLMDANSRGGGTRVKSMVWASTQSISRLSLVSGNRATTSNGLTTKKFSSSIKSNSTT